MDSVGRVILCVLFSSSLTLLLLLLLFRSGGAMTAAGRKQQGMGYVEDLGGYADKTSGSSSKPKKPRA